MNNFFKYTSVVTVEEANILRPNYHQNWNIDSLSVKALILK